MHRLETGEGKAAFEEFARIVDTGTAPNPEPRNWSLTLALEPDWLILTPPNAASGLGERVFSDALVARGQAFATAGRHHAVVPGLNAELGP